jgi:hypothetical protein
VSLIDECRDRWRGYEWRVDNDGWAACDALDLRIYDDGDDEGLAYKYGAVAHDCSGDGDTLDECVESLRADMWESIKAMGRCRRVLEGKPAEVGIRELMEAIYEPDGGGES